ncbi:hypothetical protein G6F50_018051 [Rhizopus delemar]|uniref:Uncharacterized protein n=1 Tax=Rhizopus delemar TaxID=936053 RepID=A0A9P7BZX7_9FUNG|nr:hypothetical protein G6F50_018051 [Rhizopus delemar]
MCSCRPAAGTTNRCSTRLARALRLRGITAAGGAVLQCLQPGQGVNVVDKMAQVAGAGRLQRVQHALHQYRRVQRAAVGRGLGAQ